LRIYQTAILVAIARRDPRAAIAISNVTIDDIKELLLFELAAALSAVLLELALEDDGLGNEPSLPSTVMFVPPHVPYAD